MRVPGQPCSPRAPSLTQAAPEIPRMICVCLAGVQHENRDCPPCVCVRAGKEGKKSCLVLGGRSERKTLGIVFRIEKMKEVVSCGGPVRKKIIPRVYVRVCVSGAKEERKESYIMFWEGMQEVPTDF